MKTSSKSKLKDLRIVSFESRRAREMAKLIRNYGGVPFIAPSMREIPLCENRAAIEFLTELDAGKIDFLILLTGVGLRTLLDAVAEKFLPSTVSAALRKTTLAVRGPKPAAVLKEMGLSPAIQAPEPNTWRELLSELDSKTAIKGKRVALQEYGAANQELIDGLQSRGAEVLRVPVYRWALPEDTGPLRSAIQNILNGKLDVAIFTNATQVEHLFALVRSNKSEEKLRQSFSRVLIASVGPICTEALQQFGLQADIEPDHSKMGHLISALAQQGRELLTQKRASH